jgi:prevent-host-death family protein
MHRPTTQTIEISEAEGNLDTLVGRVSQGHARLLVEKAGIPVAGLVSAEDLERLDRLDRERAERFRVIDDARAAFADASPDDIDREADRAVAELRSGAAAKA